MCFASVVYQRYVLFLQRDQGKESKVLEMSKKFFDSALYKRPLVFLCSKQPFTFFQCYLPISLFVILYLSEKPTLLAFNFDS